MAGYIATAARSAVGWELDVQGFGVAACRRLTGAREAVLDLVEEVTGARPAGASIRIRLAGELGDAMAEVRDAARVARRAQEYAVSVNRSFVASLLRDGCNQNEVALILGVTPQRASQLAHSVELDKVS